MLTIINSSIRRLTLLRSKYGLLAVALLLAHGCGGGSGSGGTGGTGANLLEGNAAFRAVAVSGFQALGAGSAYPYNALMVASPTGSAVHSKAASALIALLKHTSTVTRTASQRGATLTFVPFLNLYSAEVSFSGSIGTMSFFTDSAGTQSAGAITITLPANVGDPTDPTNFASYPTVATIAVNITGGNLPCTGNVVIKFTDSAGANSMTGTITLNKDNVAIDLNLALNDQLSVTGSVTVHESGATIQMTDVAGNVLNPLTANLTISPYGWTGTGTINLTTGALTIKLNTGKGTSVAASDSSGNIAITYADGTTDSINNAYLASLVSAGSSGSTGGGTTGGTTAATYNAPSIYTSAQRTIAMINGSGQSIGYVSQGTPVFWSTPTSQSQSLPLPHGVTFAGAAGINDAGQIVGWANGAGNNSIALYWSSPTAQPVTLSAPSTANSVIASAINRSGQIVGYYSAQTATSDNNAGLYWSSPTAQPVALKPMSDATSFSPSYIGPGGQIIDSTDDLYWATPTSSPQSLPALAGDSQGATPQAVNASGLIVGLSAAGGGISHAVTWVGATAPAQALAVFAQTISPSASAKSVNSSGVIVGLFQGFTATGDNPYFVATIWNNGKITDLNTLVPSGNAWTLGSATQITDSGWILGTATQSNHGIQTAQFILQPRQVVQN